MENGTETQLHLSPKKPFDLIESLFRHWLKIAFFGSFLFVLSMPVCCLKKQPYYKTDGKLLVSPVSTTFMAKADEDAISSYYSSYVRTQVEMIADQENLEKALQSLEGRPRDIWLPGKMPASTAARMLARRITVSSSAGTHFIVVGIEGRDPEGLAEVVNRLMAVYLERVREESEGLDSRRLKYLEDESALIKRQIEDYTKQYAAISQQTGTIYFREGTTVYNTALDSIEKEYIKAYGQRIEKENQLMAVRRDSAILQTLPLDAFVENLVQKSNTGDQMDFFTFQQVEALKSSIVGLSEGNPDRQLVEEKIKGVIRRSEQSKKVLKENAKRVLYDIRDAEAREKIIRAESEFEAAKIVEQDIKLKRDGILAEKAKMSQLLLKGQTVEEKLTTLQAQLNRIEDRINLLKLEARAPGRIIVSSEARKPVEPEGSNMKKLIALSFVLSFGSMLGLAILYDVRDDRVRSKKDVINAIGASTSWPISDYLLTREREIPFSRVTLDDSSNVVSKAIHSLSIRLNQERLKNGAKLVLVNGVDAISGVSEILVNVAYAMTRQCKKIILVDGNLVHPGLSKIVDLPENLPGLTDFLRGRLDLKACVVSCPERQIDVLPSGQMVSLNDINQLDRHKMNELLDHLRKDYDLILVDSCPILVSDFTESIAVNADIVTLIVQGDRSNYRALHMVSAIFARLNVPAVAVVLNWGAPRHRSALQVLVHRLLEPIQKRMVTSPVGSGCQEDAPEITQNADLNGSRLKLVERLAKLKSIDGRFVLSLGMLCLLGAGGMTAVQIPREPFAAENKIPGPAVFSSPVPPVPFSTHSPLGAPGPDAEKVPSCQAADEPAMLEINAPLPLTENADTLKSDTVSVQALPWIMSRPKERFSIQMMGSSQKEDLLRVVKTPGLDMTFARFQKQYRNKAWHVLMYGDFKDKKQAIEVLNRMAPSVKTAFPWVRSFGEIQAEIRALKKGVKSPA